MKMHPFLFYAAIATVGTVYSSEDVIDTNNAQLRVLKGTKQPKTTTVPDSTETIKVPKTSKSSSAVKMPKSAKVPAVGKSTKALKASKSSTTGPTTEMTGPTTSATEPESEECPYLGGGGGNSEESSSGSKSKSKAKRRMLKGKSGKKSKSSSEDISYQLSNNFGQKPGSSLVITSAEDPSLCIQPSSLTNGAVLEAVPCTYDTSDTFTVDRFGRLHTSQWSLCMIAVDTDLVIGPCGTCDAIFQFNPTTKTISLFEDPNKVVSLQDGVLSLMPPLVDKSRFLSGIIFQTWTVLLFVGTPPSSSPAPTFM